jgi:hypothetical protein
MTTQDFPPRRAEPGQVFTYTDAQGSQIDLKADDQGVAQPKSAAEVAVLDSFGLPVARKAEAEQRKERE